MKISMDSNTKDVLHATLFVIAIVAVLWIMFCLNGCVSGDNNVVTIRRTTEVSPGRAISAKADAAVDAAVDARARDITAPLTPGGN